MPRLTTLDQIRGHATAPTKSMGVLAHDLRNLVLHSLNERRGKRMNRKGEINAKDKQNRSISWYVYGVL